MEEEMQKLIDIGVPKALLDKPAVRERFTSMIKGHNAKDYIFEETKDAYYLKKRNTGVYSRFDKNCRQLFAEFEIDDIEEASFDENGIIQEYRNAGDDGALCWDVHRKSDGNGYISYYYSNVNQPPKLFIDFGFISIEDLIGMVGWGTKETSLTETLEAFENYSNRVIEKYPNLKEFYDKKRTQVTRAIIRNCLVYPEGKITATDEELKSVGATDLELELREKICEQQKRINSLMQKLKKATDFLERLKRSRFANFFFKKSLKSLNDDNDEKPF